MPNEVSPGPPILTDDELGRFWRAVEGLLESCAAAAPPLGKAPLNFLLKGQGSELLHVPLNEKVSIWQAVAVLAGEMNIVDTMNVLAAVPELEGIADDHACARKLAEVVAARAGELAKEASNRVRSAVPQTQRVHPRAS